MVKIDPALVDEEVQKQDQEVYGEERDQDQEQDTAERLAELTGDDDLDDMNELDVAKRVQDDEEDLLGIPDTVDADDSDEVESDDEIDEDKELDEDEVELDPFGGVIGKTDANEEDEEDDDLSEE